jgi:hypothetical protein
MEPEINYFNDYQRKRITRLVFVLVLINQCYLFTSNILFHQLCQPVFKFPDLDIVYWLIHLLQIPQLITGNITIAYFLDALLFILPILCILYPLKRFLIIGFLILFFVYFILFNSYSLFHCHSFIGILFIAIPFAFKNNKMVSYLWEAVRYFVCFIFFSAFLWKLYRGSAFNSDQLLAIMQDNWAAYLTFHEKTFLTGLYSYLLQHPLLLRIFWFVGIFLLEGVFVVGFFTKKYDKYLLISSIFLQIGFWFFADAFMFPILFLSLTFLNFNMKEKTKGNT